MDGDAYLLELTRYVVLNPVRARMVAGPGDWRWSSYLDVIGEKSAGLVGHGRAVGAVRD